jgi:hypothetical protein
MKSRIFIVRREPIVEGFVVRLPELARKRVERSFDKLESRGFGVAPPLAEHVEGPIYALYSKYDESRFVCVGFFEERQDQFRAFWVDVLKGRKVGRVKRVLMRREYDDLQRRPR